MADDTAAVLLSHFACAIEQHSEGTATERRAQVVSDIRQQGAELVGKLGLWDNQGHDAVTFTPLDRDLRRRCVSPTPGYCYRLFRRFECKPAVYKHLDGTALEEARAARTIAAMRI